MNIENLDKNWDLVIIGGGITGAGIMREAVRMGFKVLLVDKHDFSWGTSSRSSKLIHGGLRYLKEGKFFLTRDSVVHRERLIREVEGLVSPLGFLMPVYKDRGPGKLTLGLGLSVYDFMSLKKQHKFFRPAEFLNLAPHINTNGLVGGFRFVDAQVDDSRLVLRLIFEAESHGGAALNYTTATSLMRDPEGNITGLTLTDSESGQTTFINTKAVINATGAWAEELHKSPVSGLHLRPLRGSHLIFPQNTLPISEAISFTHPDDNRPLFAIPWEGAVLVGTTDVDHNDKLDDDSQITENETKYLVRAVNYAFPSLGITLEDCLSSIAGVRPVLSKGGIDPSKESREHVVWVDKGLVTITGGKLTTFRKLAWDTIKAADSFLPYKGKINKKEPVFDKINNYHSISGIEDKKTKHLYGRYGAKAKTIIDNSKTDLLTTIPGTDSLWAELPYAAEHENIRHLSDLLLRRVRIGLLLHKGGKEYLDKIQELCSPYVSWDDEKWKQEKSDYLNLIESKYSVPNINESSL